MLAPGINGVASTHKIQAKNNQRNAIYLWRNDVCDLCSYFFTFRSHNMLLLRKLSGKRLLILSDFNKLQQSYKNRCIRNLNIYICIYIYFIEQRVWCLRVLCQKLRRSTICFSPVTVTLQVLSGCAPGHWLPDLNSKLISTATQIFLQRAPSTCPNVLQVNRICYP